MPQLPRGWPPWRNAQPEQYSSQPQSQPPPPPQQPSRNEHVSSARNHTSRKPATPSRRASLLPAAAAALLSPKPRLPTQTSQRRASTHGATAHRPAPEPKKQAVGVCELLSVSLSHDRPHITYDVRMPVSSARVWHYPPEKLSSSERDALAVVPATSRIHIISKFFPWDIEVVNRKGVTCGDVLQAVHDALNRRIASSEWWIVQETQRQQVSMAFDKNCTETPGRDRTEGILRVDWLRDWTAVLGLVKDNDFIDRRVYDKKARPSTWVLVLTRA